MEHHRRSCIQRSDPKDDGRTRIKVTERLAEHTARRLRELARSMPQRLKNVIQNNGGI